MKIILSIPALASKTWLVCPLIYININYYNKHRLSTAQHLLSQLLYLHNQCPVCSLVFYNLIKYSVHTVMYSLRAASSEAYAARSIS